jgi:acetyl-CoA carboxylase biotin carboxyl carrier protein
MSPSSSNAGDAFDLSRIRQLVALMNEHELGEIDLRQGELRIRLRKHAEPPATAVEARPVGAAAAQSTARPASPPEAPRSDEHLVVLKSPMVGTFYGSPSPDAAAFVKVGDHVGPETTVCIIEAMKVFNEIPAETKGQIVAVLVESGAPVEYGQPLFKVDPRV